MRFAINGEVRRVGLLRTAHSSPRISNGFDLTDDLIVGQDALFRSGLVWPWGRCCSCGFGWAGTGADCGLGAPRRRRCDSDARVVESCADGPEVNPRDWVRDTGRWASL